MQFKVYKKLVELHRKMCRLKGFIPVKKKVSHPIFFFLFRLVVSLKDDVTITLKRSGILNWHKAIFPMNTYKCSLYRYLYVKKDIK